VEFFRAQLALAKDRDLPVVLHIVGAHAQALDILRKDGLPSRGGLVHSYSGPADAVSEYIELGLHLSFSGSITWPGARKAPLAVRATPPSRLLIETDSPDQTPEPHRPGRNEPAYLLQILDRVASLRGVPREELATLTTKNAHHLFEIHP
jgi:TatD DNase family protein